MRHFHSAYDLNRHPRVAAAVKIVAVAVVALTLAAAWVTAGPGNGYVPPDQWAAVHRPDVARITLPTVVITAHKEVPVPADAIAAVSCPKGA